MGLLAIGGPLPIRGLVIAIVVDTVERLTKWRVARVGVVIFEAKPPLTHGDAARAVIAVLPAIRIKTAPQHSLPATVSTGDVAAPSLAVLCVPLSQIFAPNASAAC